MIVAPAVITDRGDGEQKLGLVRDLSATGMFVYSSFRPQCGDALEIVVRLSNDSSQLVEIICAGNVIRVEEAIAGATSGFAMEIVDYQLLINGKLLLDADALARQLQQHARDAGTATHTAA